MSSPFSARSCLANPKSQMRMDSGFPDSSMYSMLLGFRSRCTTWEDGQICLTWGPGRSGKEKGRRQEVGVILESFILSRCCNRKQVCLDATPRGPSSSPSRKPGPLTVNEHLSDYTHTYTPTRMCAHTCVRTQTHPCTYMHTHATHIHTQFTHTRTIHTHMHTHGQYTHAHTCVHTNACTPNNKNVHTHTHIHAHTICICTHRHTHTLHTHMHMHAHMWTHTYTYTHMHTHKCIYAHTNICAHTSIHTCTHTHKQTAETWGQLAGGVT